MNESILSKIKKLKNMESSARDLGNEAEALAFASRIQQLLFDYKIEMAEVEDFNLETDVNIEIALEIYDWYDVGIKKSKKASSWLAQLASVVSKYNNCKAVSFIGSNAVQIIGTEESRTVVTWLLSVLARYGSQAVEFSYRKKYYEHKKQGTEYLMKGYRRAFLSSYVGAIAKRLQDQWSADRLNTISERGLVIIDKEVEAVKDFLDQMDTKKIEFRGTNNSQGFYDGKEVGEKVSLGTNAVGGSQSTKMLS